MLNSLSDTLSKIAQANITQHLSHINAGLEKEGLRVSKGNSMAHTPHPKALGSALTHSSITTDYTEALLEFITPVMQSPQGVIDTMQTLHSFNASVLTTMQEKLWPASMPCYLKGEADIPIANFGTSNTGQLKHIYRVGLAHRYGKIMQTIAGIHYNFSLTDEFWQTYQTCLKDNQTPDTFRSDQYFSLIRNFRRHAWLLVYLFGASPAFDTSFITGQNAAHAINTEGLQKHDKNTLFGPYATSLRMSDLGYNSQAQTVLNVCFNELDTYIQSLQSAIKQPTEEYQAIGVKVDGKYRQLSPNLLQIENEYYSDIRPKRVTATGQKPIHALKAQGVEYIEIRNLDINPLLPLGFDEQQLQFINLFLLWCLFSSSPTIDDDECLTIKQNMAQIVRYGRQPNVTLQNPQGDVSMQSWAHQILTEMHQVAQVLPQSQNYNSALTAMQARIDDSNLTPSAQVLNCMQAQQLSHQQWVAKQADKHQRHHLQQIISSANKQALTQQAINSLDQQKVLEAAQKQDFDSFLADYLAS